MKRRAFLQTLLAAGAAMAVSDVPLLSSLSREEIEAANYRRLVREAHLRARFAVLDALEASFWKTPEAPT
jgi:hypothetical protein